MRYVNPLSANPTKWSNTLKQFVGKLPTNCLSVFDHFVELALKGLKKDYFVKNTAILMKKSNEKGNETFTALLFLTGKPNITQVSLTR